MNLGHGTADRTRRTGYAVANNLCLWTFGDPGAARSLERRLCDGGLDPVVVADGVLLTWPSGCRVPQLRELRNVGRSLPLGYDFWGLLFGIVRAGPSLAPSTPGKEGLFDDLLQPVGIDRDFINAVRVALGPGTSALAGYCDDTTADRITIGCPAPRAPAGPTPDIRSVVARCRLSQRHDRALRRIFAQ